MQGHNGGVHRVSIEASMAPVAPDSDALQDLEKRSCVSNRSHRSLLPAIEIEGLNDTEGKVQNEESMGEVHTGETALNPMSPTGRRALPPILIAANGNNAPESSEHAAESCEIQEEHRQTLTRSQSLASRSSVHSDDGTLPHRVTKDSPWLTFLESEYALSAVESGSKLDNLMREVRKAKRNQSTIQGSALYALLRNRYVRIGMVFFLAFNLYLLVSAIQIFWQFKRTVKSVKITVFDLADGSSGNLLVNVESVGVLSRACEQIPSSAARTADSVELLFAREVEIDGWFFATNGTDTAKDPSSFEIRVVGSAGDGQGELLPQHNFRAGLWEHDASSLRWKVSAPLERGRVMLTLEPPDTVKGGTAAVAAVTTAATALVLVLSMQEKLLEARVSTGSALLCIGVLSAAVAVTLQVTGERALSFMWLRTALSCTLTGPFVLSSRLKPLFISAVSVNSTIHLVLLLADLVLRAREERKSALVLLWLTHETYIAGGGVVLASALALYQRRVLAGVFRSIHAGREALDKAWEEALQAMGDGREGVLHRIRSRVKYMSRRMQQRPRHRVFQHQEGAQRPRRLLDMSGGGTVVRSLDQLYAQAKCCRILLRDTVQQLALQCEGMFPYTGRQLKRGDAPPKFVTWSKAASESDGEYANAINWAPLKPSERAIDKALNHYVGDVSRLVDICRETIVLPDLNHVVHCLDAIHADRSIVVERVLNTLSVDIESRETGGFRAVVLNLRIANPASKAMGVDGHICELVLLPVAIAEKLSEEECQGLRQLRDASRHSGAGSWVKGLLRRIRRWEGLRGRRESLGLDADEAWHGSFIAPGRGLADRSGRRSSLGRVSADNQSNERSGSVGSLLSPPETPAPALAASARLSSGLSGSHSPAPLLLREPPTLQAYSSAPLFSTATSTPSGTNPPPAPATPGGARPGLLRNLSNGSGFSGSQSNMSRRNSVFNTLRRQSEAAVQHLSNILSLERSKSVHSAGSGREMTKPRDFEPPGSDSAWYKLMESQFRVRATSTKEKLNDMKLRISFAVQNSDDIAVFDTSFPIAAAMCKPWFLAVAAVFGMTYLAVGALSLHRLAHLGEVSTQWLWFNVSKLRGGLPVSGAETIGAFGIRSGACQVVLEDSVVLQQSGWQLQMQEALSFDGFFFQTAGEGKDSSLDPVAYSLQQSDDGAVWSAIAGWHRTFPLGGYQRWPETSSKGIATPEARDALVTIDFRPPGFVWFLGPIPNLLLGGTWLAVGLFGLAHHRRWGHGALRQLEGGVEVWLVGGKVALIVGLWLSGLCLAAGAGQMQAEGFEEYLVLHCLWAVASLGVPLLVMTWPQLLIEVLALWGMAGLILHAISDLSTDPPPVTEGGEHHAPSGLLLVVGMLLAVMRWRSRVKSMREVLEDVRQYEQVWHRMLLTEDVGLRLVEERVEEMASRCTDKRALVQQFVPQRGSLHSAGPRRRTNLSGKHRMLGLLQGEGLARRWFTRSQNAPASRTPVAKRDSTDRSRVPPAQWSQEDLMQLDLFETQSPPGVGRVKMWCESDLASSHPTPRHPSSNGSRRKHKAKAAAGDTDAPRLSRELLRRTESAPQLPQPELEARPGAAEAAALGTGPVRRTSSGRGERGSTDSVQSTELRSLSVDGSPVGAAGVQASTAVAGRAHLTGTTMSLSALERRNGRLAGSSDGKGDQGLGDMLSRAASNVSSESDLSRSAHSTTRLVSRSLRKQNTMMSRMALLRRQGTSRFVKELFSGKASATPATSVELTGKELRVPVDCLDQLYAQAAGVLPHLKHKVQVWARHSAGLFPLQLVSRGPGARDVKFERWDALLEEHQTAERAADKVKWASLKDAGRAVEKTLRSYDGKAGRLLDVCRQSIVFDSAADLAHCLSLIAGDTDVEVLAIKNRFGRDYDAKSMSLGYRDVNLNLRFVTPACRRLGIHLHICEVQLLLRDFAQLKNDAGHKRYVAFRNARGK